MVFLSKFLCTFVPQPDEETGSAEEQPASNKAVPTLKAVEKLKSRPWVGRLTAFRRAFPLKKPFRRRRNTKERFCSFACSSFIYVIPIF